MGALNGPVCCGVATGRQLSERGGLPSQPIQHAATAQPLMCRLVVTINVTNLFTNGGLHYRY